MRRLLIGTVVAIGCAVATISATVVVPAAFVELVSESSLFVRGRITDVRTVPVPDGGIDSIATVAVVSVLKGQADSVVFVRAPGGQLGRTRFVMVGAPVLTVGQSAILLLTRGADGLWRPLALSAGVVPVQRDRVTGRAVVTPPVATVGRPSTGPVVRGDLRRRPIPVEEFDSWIRAAAEPRRRAVPR
jgi:hypothetical protein